MKLGGCLGTAAIVLTLGGCGGGNQSGSSAQGQPTLVKAVAPPAGAVAPSTLGTAGLAKLVRVPRGGPLPSRGLSNAAITQAIPTVSERLNQFWSQEFARSGIRWQKILHVLVQSAPVKTPCSTTVSPSGEMFLCIGDAAGDTFYWTVPWMQQNVDTGSNRMNLALGMAGLYSDVVLDVFGFKDRLASGAETSSAFHQQKFCLTGVYAASLMNRGLVRQAGLQAIGNYLGFSGGSGATRQQLETAFAAGLASGSPATCARPNVGTKA